MNRYEDSTGPGIGATLKDARRRLGMDIREAETRTKIRTRYLRALEAEDWEVLPAPAYVRGFLRVYGQILGLDGEVLADRYRRSYEEPVAVASAAAEPVLSKRRAPGTRPSSRSGLILVAGGAVVVLLVILAILGLTSGDDDGPATRTGKQANSDSRGGGGHKAEGKGGRIEREPRAGRPQHRSPEHGPDLPGRRLPQPADRLAGARPRARARSSAARSPTGWTWRGAVPSNCRSEERSRSSKPPTTQASKPTRRAYPRSPMPVPTAHKPGELG